MPGNYCASLLSTLSVGDAQRSGPARGERNDAKRRMETGKVPSSTSLSVSFRTGKQLFVLSTSDELLA
jgi:hypothetical protein